MPDANAAHCDPGRRSGVQPVIHGGFLARPAEIAGKADSCSYGEKRRRAMRVQRDLRDCSGAPGDFRKGGVKANCVSG